MKDDWVKFSQLSVMDIVKVLFVSALIGLALAFAIINKFWIG